MSIWGKTEFAEVAVPKGRPSKAQIGGNVTSGISGTDLGRFLGSTMRKDYDAALPEGPLPDELVRLVEKLQSAGKPRCVTGRR